MPGFLHLNLSYRNERQMPGKVTSEIFQFTTASIRGTTTKKATR